MIIQSLTQSNSNNNNSSGGVIQPLTSQSTGNKGYVAPKVQPLQAAKPFSVGQNVGNFFSGLGTAVNNALTPSTISPLPAKQTPKLFVNPVQQLTQQIEQSFGKTQTNKAITDLTTNTLSLNNPKQALLDWFSTKPAKSIAQGFMNDVIQETATWNKFLNTMKGNDTTAKVGQGAEVVSSHLNTLFSPLTTFFQVSTKIPVVGVIPKIANVAFTALNEGGSAVVNKALYTFLPKDVADKLAPGFDAIGGLVATMLAGKIFEVPQAKVNEIVGKFGLQEGMTIKSQAEKIVAQKALTEGSHPPEDVISHVVNNELENTPEGKNMLKTAVQAQQEGNSIEVSHQGDPQAFQDIKAVKTPLDTTLNPIADRLTSIVSNRDNFSNSEQSSLSSFNSLVSAKTFESFTSETKTLSQQFDKDFTLLYNDISSGNITKEDYETYIQQRDQVQTTEGENTANTGQNAQGESNRPNVSRSTSEPSTQVTREGNQTNRSNETSSRISSQSQNSNATENVGSRSTGNGKPSTEPDTHPSGNGQTVKVPRENLPIGQGKEKVSALQERISKALESVSPETKDKLGATTYREMNNKDTIKAASEYVIENPEEALQVLTGEIDAPKGLNSNSIYVALANSELGTDLGLKLATLKSTAMGQNIEILKELNPYSPVKILSDIYKISEAKLAKKYGTRSVDKVINTMVEKGKVNIKPPMMKDWKSILKEVRC